MADNNEDNTDNIGVPDPQVEDEGSRVANPPQVEVLLDEFDDAPADVQEEAVRAA